MNFEQGKRRSEPVMGVCLSKSRLPQSRMFTLRHTSQVGVMSLERDRQEERRVQRPWGRDEACVLQQHSQVGSICSRVMEEGGGPVGCRD